MLERWRERDVFRESVRRREGAEPFVFYEGPPTANGPPGCPPRAGARVQGHLPALQDDARALVERKGGWDCHGLPVEIAVEQQLGFKPRPTSSATASPSSTQQCRESVFTYLDEWNRLTERIGYWVDLDDAYRTLDHELRRVGLVGAEDGCGTTTCSTRATRSCPTARAAAPRCPRTRSRRATRTSRTRPSTCASRSRAPRAPLREGDALLVWTTTPWTLVSNAAVAVDPELTYVRARPTATSYVLAEALVERVLGEGARSLDRFRRRATCSAPRYEPPFPYIPADGVRPRRATPSCPATSSPPTTAPASSTPRSRSARTTSGSAPSRASPSSTRCGWTAPTTSASARTPGRLGQGRRRRPRRGPARARAPPARRALPALLPALLALRDAAALLRQAVLVHRARQSLRDRLLAANETVDLAPRAHQARALRQVAREQRRLGHLARALLGHAAARLAQRRRGETVAASGPSPSCAKLSGARGRATRTARTSTTSRSRRRRGGEPLRRVPEVHRRVVRLGLDAVRPVRRAARGEERFEAHFPADFICEALDQTRGWFYSLLAVSTLLFDRAPYENVVVPRAHPRRRGPEDVQVHGQRRRAVGGHRPPRRRRVPLVLLHLQAALGRLPLLVETVGESVRQFLLQLWNTYGFYVLYANVNDVAPATLGRAGRPSSTAGRSRGCTRRPRRARAARRLRRDVRRPRDRRRSSTSCRTGTCAARGGASGTATRAAFAHAAPLPGDGRAAARAVHARSSPTRSTRTSTASPSRASTCATSPSPARATSTLERAMARRARDRAARARRARAGQAQGAPAAARGGRGRGRRRARGDRAARRRRARGAERQGAALRLAGRRARLLRGQAELPRARAALRAGTCRRSRPPSRRSTRPPSRTRCATARTVGVSIDGHDHELGADDLQLALAAARGLPARARGLARRRARPRARRRAAPRGLGARDRARGPGRAQGAPGSRSTTGSRSRSAATTSCSPPRARTRTTWPARRWPSPSATTACRRPSRRSSTAARCRRGRARRSPSAGRRGARSATRARARARPRASSGRSRR